jgi:hypothetical protein
VTMMISGFLLSGETYTALNDPLAKTNTVAFDINDRDEAAAAAVTFTSA